MPPTGQPTSGAHGAGRAEHFQYGSPLSGNVPSAPSAAAPPNSFGSNMPRGMAPHFDSKEWNVEGKKVSKELKIFDGDLATYDTWRMRVRNHFIGTNYKYSMIFDIIENCKTPIKWALLPETHHHLVPGVDWTWISTHIWTFTGNWLSDTQMSRRLTLVGGEEFNGAEFWRTLHAENVGGSAQLANLERGHFIGFPQCTDPANLEPHLKQWVQLKNKYGKDLPSEHLIGMLWAIIPEAMKEKIKEQKRSIKNNV